MADRKPLVLITGRKKELPAGDTIVASSVSSVSTAPLAASDVQAALNELANMASIAAHRG